MSFCYVALVRVVWPVWWVLPYLCSWGTSMEGLYLFDRLRMECCKIHLRLAIWTKSFNSLSLYSHVPHTSCIYEGRDNRHSHRKTDVEQKDAAKQKATNPKLKFFFVPMKSLRFLETKNERKSFLRDEIQRSEAAEMLADASIVPAFHSFGSQGRGDRMAMFCRKLAQKPSWRLSPRRNKNII